MPDWVPLNWTLMSRWQNWVIIVLMLAIAGIGFDAIMRWGGADPHSSADN